MKIAGFKKQTLIDYPGNISAVVFTQGCNFRCGFCHNPNLVIPAKFTKTYSEREIFNYLEKYRKMLDAVSITGGEPTIHNDLPVFIEKIKKLEMKVKLDSNGTNPEMLQELIRKKHIDFIAMDIKHLLDFDKYNKTVGEVINNSIFNRIKRSVELIKKSTVEYEFRTTVVKNLHLPPEILTLKKQFGENYKIQNFNSEIVLNSLLHLEAYSEKEFSSF